MTKPNLQYYDVNKPAKTSVDESQIGNGAVLLQNDFPAAYALKHLQIEENDMQI